MGGGIKFKHIGSVTGAIRIHTTGRPFVWKFYVVQESVEMSAITEEVFSDIKNSTDVLQKWEFGSEFCLSISQLQA